jgi:outer membrane biosynthesis protein TonB
MRIGNRDITFLFSLCCSLLINTGMVDVVLLRARPPSVLNLSRWHTRPSKASLPTARETAFITPPEPEKKLDFDNREVFGESNANGDAPNSSPGDVPLQAAEGPQNQAFLGRMTGGGGGGGGGNGAQAMIGATSPQEQMTPRPQQPKVVQAEQQARPEVKPDDTTDPDKAVAAQTKTEAQQAVQASQATPTAAQATPTAAQAAPSAAQASPSAAQAAAVSPGAPGSPGPRGAANPAPFSDRDSDPFSEKQISVSFVNGQVVARNGRKVKTVKPQILQAGYLEMSLMGNPRVTFLATVDENGNVIHVQLYRSSGSDNIDLPCQEAVEQWWIEPSKDKSGKPVKDLVPITIAFY